MNPATLEAKVLELDSVRQATTGRVLASIDSFIAAIRQEQAELRAGNTDLSHVQAHLAHAQAQASLGDPFTALHEKVSKLSKVFDKDTVNLECLCPCESSASETAALDRMIANYLCRRGAFTAASTMVEDTKVELAAHDVEPLLEPNIMRVPPALIHKLDIRAFLRAPLMRCAPLAPQEAKVELAAHDVEPLLELHCAAQGLLRRDLAPASEWAQRHRHQLAAVGSTLELQLVQLEFIGLLQKEGGGKEQLRGLCAELWVLRHDALQLVTRLLHESRDAALAFARARFPALLEASSSTGAAAASPAAATARALSRLMGALLHPGLRCLRASPYARLTRDAAWRGSAAALARDGHRALGLPAEAPLAAAARAGAAAAPTLLKMAAVAAASGRAWDAGRELFSDVPLPRDLSFHSVFSCPVTRETVGGGGGGGGGGAAANAPVLLRCGHVVARASVERLPKHGSGGRFKCPTCPMEQTQADVRVLRI
ncbi:hypothetical protein JKP88DRAFT_321499 [Tribonema minus]|uniref:CTLH/CRA C-terminal to LisH motif domain-containing protein n=1 Tax=Tribonema minus TaxID=303371 RepID=A0A836CDL5_9STRA|nr:hypothetical protein JKP88DRAFT_321499 [Tribonema minus]